MDSITTELRIAGRILQETWGGIQRSGWMNLIIIITMAAILSIFGTLLSFIIETRLFFQHVGSGFEISAYLKPEASISIVGNEIRKIPGVVKIEAVPKKQAWKDMRETLNIEDMTNPLPDTIHIKTDTSGKIQSVVSRLEGLKSIEEVSYAKKIVSQLEDISNFVSILGVVISIFLGLMTMFVISNTIHLLIEARGREIEILRMMGVGNWYIRLPFLFQGAVYGLIGAIIAYIPLSLAVFSLSKMFEAVNFSTHGFSLGIVFTIMLLMGVMVGSGGAANSIRKYLRV